jgi:hypothetical protein
VNNDSVNVALAVARLGQVRRVLEGLAGLVMGIWTVASMALLWVALDPSDPARLFHAAILFGLYPCWAWARAVAATIARLGQK